MREISTVAAYGDRWHITGNEIVGSAVDGVSSEQAIQRRLAKGGGIACVGTERGGSPWTTTR